MHRHPQKQTIGLLAGLWFLIALSPSGLGQPVPPPATGPGTSTDELGQNPFQDPDSPDPTPDQAQPPLTPPAEEPPWPPEPPPPPVPEPLPPAPAPAAPPAAETRSEKVFSFGGYIKFDAIYNSAGNLVGGAEPAGAADLTDYLLVPGAVPLEGLSDGGGLNFNARESRFWLKTELSTSYGLLKTFIEVDLYGFSTSLGDERTTNSSALQVRHAYGQLGNLLAGQFWSTFMDVPALPDTIDFGSPAGRVFTRQAMVRYTIPLAPGMILDLAAESPETTLTSQEGARVTRDDDLVPDLIARYTYDVGNMHFTTAAMVRTIRYDDEMAGVSETKIAPAAGVTGKIGLLGKHSLRFAVNGGLGIGRYMGLNAFNDGLIRADGSLELIPAVGGHVSYQHALTAAVKAMLCLSYAHVFNNTDEGPETVNKALRTVHANVFWSILPSMRVGIEGIYAYREREDSTDGTLIRGQGAIIYTY